MSHDIPFPVIGQLISTIGRNLTNLDLSETQAICSEGLGSLLRRCPALKELKIYHDGSFWAKTTRPSHPLPQIEELSLRLPRLESTAPFIPPSEVMRDSLGRLYTLRVEGHVVSDFENNREALKSMLHSVPRIQTFRFHFDITSVSQGRWPYTYPEARTLKWDRMGIDPTSPDALGHFPLDKQCVLAFLSVVKRFGAGGSVLSDFNRDVLGTILSFTSRTKPREIWIQDEGVDASVGRNSVTRAMIRSSLTLSTETLGD